MNDFIDSLSGTEACALILAGFVVLILILLCIPSGDDHPPG